MRCTKKIFGTIIVFIILTASSYPKSGQIEWKYAVAFNNGIPKYFDPRMDMGYPEMYISKIYREKYHVGSKIYSNGLLVWSFDDGKSELGIYSMLYTEKDDSRIVQSLRKLKFMVTNEGLYLKDAKSDWEKLEFRIVATNPAPNIIYTFYLKSRWFEGEYNYYFPW